MQEGSDGRKPTWFWVDDVIIDEYAERIGPIALALYITIVRHAKKNGEAFPSISRMQKLTGVARNTVRKYLELLEQQGLIARERRVSDDGDPTSTRYTVLHPGGGSTDDLPRSTDDLPRSTDDPGVGQHVTHPGQQMTHGGSTRDPEGITLKELEFEGRKEPLSHPSDEPLPIPPSLRAALATNSYLSAVLTPEMLVALYNAETPDQHPKVQTLSPERRRKALVYLRHFPRADFWHNVMHELSASDFCLGLRAHHGHQTFKATFDWLLSKGKDGSENCVKVAEGNYRNPDSAAGFDYTDLIREVTAQEAIDGH